MEGRQHGHLGNSSSVPSSWGCPSNSSLPLLPLTVATASPTQEKREQQDLVMPSFSRLLSTLKELVVGSYHTAANVPRGHLPHSHVAVRVQFLPALAQKPGQILTQEDSCGVESMGGGNGLGWIVVH